jgi:hypothetical protein
MAKPKRPKDFNQAAKLIVDMSVGNLPNDKNKVLSYQEEKKKVKTSEKK